MTHMTSIRKGFIYLALVVVVLIAASCSSQLSAINTGADGLAIKGYDTVAYFTMGKPVKGLSEYSYEWEGATWLFSNRAHLDLFVANPDKYAPQFGGY